MKANVLYGVNDLRYVDYDLPVLKEDEVLVKVCAAGVCGSDIARVFKTGTYHFPTIIGHEFSGEVVDVKDEKNAGLIGKRVGVFPLKPCFKCANCLDHHYELCVRYDYLGSRCDGGFAEYVAVPVWNLLLLPDSLGMDAAAMLEPASVALHTLRQACFKDGMSIAVIGPGTIGMIICKLAAIYGANLVVLIGRSQEKLDFAQQYDIKQVCNSQTENVTTFSHAKTNGLGFDVVIEGTGAEQSLCMSLGIVRAGGKVLTLGNPLGDIALPKTVYWKILRKQVIVQGTWNSSFGFAGCDWEKIVSLMEKGLLDVTPLITHRLPLNGLMEGLWIMQDKTIYSNKVMIINDGI